MEKRGCIKGQRFLLPSDFHGGHLFAFPFLQRADHRSQREAVSTITQMRKPRFKKIKKTANVT